MMLASPTDTRLANLLQCRTSWVTEEYGADVIASTPLGLYACQRKTVYDFLESVIDGRLGRELGLIRFLPFPQLVLEGQMEFTNDGYLMTGRKSQWTRVQIRNLLRSCWWFHGVPVEYSDSIEDTARVVRETIEWVSKRDHRGLLTRPGVEAGADWGVASRRTWGIYFLQGLPGVGPVRAESIYDNLGLPFKWTCNQKDLESIKGLGKQTAKQLITAFDSEQEED